MHVADVLDEVVHDREVACVVKPDDALGACLRSFTLLSFLLVANLSEHVHLLLITQMGITLHIRLADMLKPHIHSVCTADRVHAAHDKLVEVVLPEHVRMVDQDLLHDVEGHL
jgi:hypothetical protein